MSSDLFVQIEDPEPLDELEAIVEVPGIDMLFFGPGDFSQGIGAPGKWDDPRIAQTRKRIAEVCRHYGKFAGTVGGMGNLQDLHQHGLPVRQRGRGCGGSSSHIQTVGSGIWQRRTGKISIRHLQG